MALNRCGALRRPAATEEKKQHQTSQNSHYHPLSLLKSTQRDTFSGFVTCRSGNGTLRL